MAASAAAAPQMWAPAYADVADPDRLIGEAEEAIIKRSKHAGWVYEFRRMAREREESQLHNYAFCTLKATAHLCDPLLIDELRESGGETPDRIRPERLMELYLRLRDIPGLGCGVVPATVIQKIAAAAEDLPPGLLPASTMEDVRNPEIDVFVIGDSSLGMKKTRKKGGYHPGSFSQELTAFSGRTDKGIRVRPGITDVIPVMDAGIRQIKTAVQKEIEKQISRGRNPETSMRLIIRWQFNEFFKGTSGIMKTVFPFDIIADIQE